MGYDGDIDDRGNITVWDGHNKYEGNINDLRKRGGESDDDFPYLLLLSFWTTIAAVIGLYVLRDNPTGHSICMFGLCVAIIVDLLGVKYIISFDKYDEQGKDARTKKYTIFYLASHIFAAAILLISSLFANQTIDLISGNGGWNDAAIPLIGTIAMAIIIIVFVYLLKTEMKN